MPAFLYGTQICRIYVGLSPYLSTTAGQTSYPVHINVAEQSTNKSVLVRQDTFGLKLDAVIKQEKNTGKYYVDLNVDEYDFKPYQYYKVQFRLCQNSPYAGERAASYLNRAIYSEWSTACLIKFIKKPEVSLSYFENDKTKIKNIDTSTIGQIGTRFPDSAVFVSGKVSFPDNTGLSSEYLKSYQIQFLNSTSDILEDSGEISSLKTSINELNYVAKYNFQPNQLYKMVIYFTSSGLYEWTETYNFTINKGENDSISFYSSLNTDSENGRFLFNIYTQLEKTNPYYDKEAIIYIRRTDSKNNYEYWEDVFSQKTILQSGFLFGWQDITIESGVWYKYAIQYGINGLRYGDYSISNTYSPIKVEAGTSIVDNGYYEYDTTNDRYIQTIDTVAENKIYYQVQDKQIIIFDNSFLTGPNGQQLKLKYDTTFDSYTYHQGIQKIETIGNKYPFIRQNGEMNYRTFSLGGLITFLTDMNIDGGGLTNNIITNSDSTMIHSAEENITSIQNEIGLFITKEKLYGNISIYNEYKKYFENQNFSDYDNIIQEKFFRDAVIDFLLQDNVLLFRSATEGNILIKLSDVSFTPKQELGRYIYNFTSNATECEEATITNYNIYRIQALSNQGYTLLKQEYTPEILSSEKKASASGVTLEISAGSSENVKTIIEDNYASMDEYFLAQISFYSLGMSFLSEPYSINLTTKMPGNPSSTDSDNYINGYLVNIDNETFIVSAQNPYINFHNENNEKQTINTITFPAETRVNLLMDAEMIYVKTEIASGPETTPTGTIDLINVVNRTISIKNTTLWHDSQGVMEYNTDFILPVKNYVKRVQYNISDNSTNSFIFIPYNIIIKDAPRGALLSIQDATETIYCMIGDTGNLNYDLRANLSETDDTQVLRSAKFLGQIAVWDDTVNTSDVKIKMAASMSQEGLYYKANDNKWVWIGTDAKQYDVEFYDTLPINTATPISITTNKTLTSSDFKYLRIKCPINITGDIMISARVVTSV